MASYTFFLLATFISVPSSSLGLQILDEVKPSCIVKTDQGTLDLSSLATTSDTARFSAELPQSEGGSGSIYWNPCNDISPPDCADEQAGSGELYLLVTSGSGPITTDCSMVGAKSNSKFAVSGDKLLLKYGLDSAFAVTFSCGDGDNKLSLPSMDDETQTEFSGKGACFSAAANTTPNPGGGKGGLSAGSVILIIALVFAVVYFVAGVILKKFYKKKEGSDVIPKS